REAPSQPAQNPTANAGGSAARLRFANRPCAAHGRRVWAWWYTIVWKGRYRARKAAPGGGRGRRPRGARSRITMATRCSATEARGAGGGGGGGGGGERERESERLCMQNHGSSTGSVTLATAVSNKHSLSNTCCAPRRGGSRQDLVLGQAALPHRPRFIEDRDFEVLARTLNERQSSLAGKGCISQGGRTKAGKTSVIWRAL
ncbi:unnamed protein product, partial [Prorocentrum cordatum]